MNARPQAESEATLPKRQRRHRSRPVPKWLLNQQNLDAMAQRRCLMILSVLSGERPVTDVLSEAQISRGTYYQLEERALKAMLVALSPQVAEGAQEVSPSARIAQLEAKVTKLTQEKRRAERLLLLTRKVVRKGPVVTGLGRPRGKRRRSTLIGKKPSNASSTETTSSPSSVVLIPTKGGGGVP